jgi:RNA recognition motif-containing protein
MKGEPFMFKIFIGNIAPQTSRTDLKELFGEVASVQRVEFLEASEFPSKYLDSYEVRSRGVIEAYAPTCKFGVVEIASESEARAVVDAFNGIELPGTLSSGLMLFGPHGGGDEP